MTSQGIEKGRTDLLGYLQITWRRKWLVLLVAVGVLGATMWSTYRTEPTYQARVTLQLSTSGGPPMLDRLGGFFDGPIAVESEVEILKSRVIGERTAVKLQKHYALNPLPPGVSLELTDVTVTEKTLSGVYVVTFVDDAGLYQVKDPSGNVIGVGRVGQPFEARGLSVTLSKVTARSGNSVEVRINPLADLGEGLRGQLSVIPVRGTNIIDIRVKANEPWEAARTANAVAETYVDFTRQQNLLRLVSVREFLERQLASFREDMLKVGEELAKKSKEGQEVALGQLTIDNVKSELAKRLVELEMQRVAMKFTHGPNHSALIRVEREIQEIRDQLTKQLRPEKQDLPLMELVQGSHARLAIYNYMLQKQQETRLAEAAELGSARIIDRAIPPKAPVSPNISRNVKFGAMVGLSLGIGLALFLGHMDRSVKNVSDLQEKARMPVFGLIPEIVTVKRRKWRILGQSKKNVADDRTKLLVYMEGEKKWALESYRALRTNIRFARSEGISASAVFLFTSVAPGEGKSLTVANLAITMSQPKTRILVVDLDFRKPTQHHLFGLKTTVGLTEVLVGEHRWQDAVLPVGVGNVDLVASGRLPPDPGELLGSQAMREFLEEARQVYDAILLDSAPLSPYADACVTAPMVAGVFLVVRVGRTTYEELARGESMLAAVNAKITGVVLNRASRATAYPYYYYHDSDGLATRRQPARIRRLVGRFRGGCWE